MKDEARTKKELIRELQELRRREADMRSAAMELKQLEENQEKFTKAFMENATPMVISTIAEGRYIDVSDAFLNLTGRRREEVIGKTSTEIGFLTREQRAAFIDGLHRKGRIDNFEAQVVVREGELKTGLFNSSRISLGGEDYLLTVITDITGLKRVEEDLRQKEQQLRDTAEAIPGAIYQFYARPDGKMGFHYISESARGLFGLNKDPEDYLERFSARVAPECLQSFTESIKEAVSSVKPWRYEGKFIKDSGEAIWFLALSNPIAGPQEILFNGVVLDITDRVKSQELLRESEELYHAIFEAMPVMMWLKDTKNNHLRINKAAADLEGVPPEAIAGKSAYELYPPEQAEAFYQDDLQVITSGKPKLGIVEAHTAVGTSEKRWLEVGKVPVRDSQKEIIGVMVFAVDITERLNAEVALRKSEAKFREVFETIEDLYYETNSEGIITVLSPSLHRLTGWNHEDLVGKPVASVYANPDARKRMLLKLSEHGYISDYEVLLKKKDGEVRHASLSARLILDDQGQPIGVRGLLRDITKRIRAEEKVRKSEENYRLLFENAGEGILIAQDEIIRVANPASLEMLGYPREKILSRPFVTFIHPDDREKVLDRHLRRMRGETVPTNYTFRIVTEDGTERWLKINSSLVSWDGAPSSLSFLEDITDRTQMESQLIQSQRLEAIGTLSGGMAHNFNNILNGIQGFASLMRMSMNPDNTHYEWLKLIEEQVNSGAELTRQLLAFARGGHYAMKPLDINKVLSRLASLYGKAKREVVMQIRLEEDTMTVLADQNQMEQVFLNLFMNASQAMPAGGTIHLTTQRVFLTDMDVHPYEAAPGPYIKISVTDTGVGMDAKTQERIFEPFFTTKPAGQGTGLGLSSVYGIVKSHGGFVHVDSKPGRGATFTIYLPATEQEIVPERAAVTEILKGTEAILVVDDDKATREVCQTFLESLGYRVFVAGSGREATSVYRERHQEIDLVLLDMIMPEISGGETFERLKEISPAVRVILCSGYSVDGEAEKILARGCKGFLQKPLRLEKLSGAIRQALDD